MSNFNNKETHPNPVLDLLPYKGKTRTHHAELDSASLITSLRGAKRRGNPLKIFPSSTLSRICKFAYRSLTNSTLSQRERVKCGFTLAEVLITLGIIGVVAVLTIAPLIQKYQEKEFVTKYKRVYSVLNQAYKFAENEYGPYSDWELSSHSIYEKMIPYLKLGYDCTGIQHDRYLKKCGITDRYLTGYTRLNGTRISIYDVKPQPLIKLVSGETIIFHREQEAVDFVVDLNGSKKPNRLGVDIHYLSFSNENGANKILPGSTWERGNVPKRCLRDNPAQGWAPGSACGYWILKYDNMDYLRLPSEEIIEKW